MSRHLYANKNERNLRRSDSRKLAKQRRFERWALANFIGFAAGFFVGIFSNIVFGVTIAFITSFILVNSFTVEEIEHD